MSEDNNASFFGGDDTFDALHKNFNLSGSHNEQNTGAADPGASYGTDDVYFSQKPSGAAPQPRRTSSGAKRPAKPKEPSGEYEYHYDETPPAGSHSGARKRPAKSSAAKKSAGSKKSAAAPLSGGKKKRGKKKRSSRGLILALFIIVIVAGLSFALRIPIMGCVNDILAIDRDNVQMRVIVGSGMTTDQVIDLLGEKDLIYSPTFCKFVADFLGYDKKTQYPAGTYYLSSDMGVEEMLRTIKIAGVDKSTIRLTFPEGYTVDQIIEKLSNNGVASSMSLYAALDDDSFFQQYDFLANLTNRQDRYHALEGYLFPNTYEFYIGENPRSVFSHFLDEFKKRWSSTYSTIDRNGHSIDEIITVASILEKEGKDAEQMKDIAGVLYNRLESSSFPYINCDSTAIYIENAKDLIDASKYDTILSHYRTYDPDKTGLPAGPICNPGENAIAAALQPNNSDYYYFLHDQDGKLYLAESADEHAQNMHMAGLE